MSILQYSTDTTGVWWYGYKVGNNPPQLISTASTDWPVGTAHDDRVKRAESVEYFFDPAVTKRPLKPKDTPAMIPLLDLKQFIIPQIDFSAFAAPQSEICERINALVEPEYTPFVEVSQQMATAVTESGIDVLSEIQSHMNSIDFISDTLKPPTLGFLNVPPIPPHTNDVRYFSLDAPEQVETPPVAIDFNSFIDSTPGKVPLQGAARTIVSLEPFITADRRPQPPTVAIPWPDDNLPALTDRFAPAEHTPWHPYDREVPGQYGYYEVRVRMKSTGSEFSAFSLWDHDKFQHHGHDLTVFAWRGLTEDGRNKLIEQDRAILMRKGA